MTSKKAVEAGKSRRPVGVFETPGGKNYLEHLLSLHPSKTTRDAIAKVQEQDREAASE